MWYDTADYDQGFVVTTVSKLLKCRILIVESCRSCSSDTLCTDVQASMLRSCGPSERGFQPESLRPGLKAKKSVLRISFDSSKDHLGVFAAIAMPSPAVQRQHSG